MIKLQADEVNGHFRKFRKEELLDLQVDGSK
jgi:hypothetical protein